MTAVVVSPGEAELREDLKSFGKTWWLFLVAGFAWIWMGFVVLSFTWRSVAAISFLVGAMLFLAAIEELGHAFLMSGWRWLHGLLSILFLVGAVFSIAYPGQTFGSLAILIGWFLLIKGSVSMAVAFASVGTPLWWVVLISGVIEIAVALWAIGYPGRSAWLLVVWVGIGAIFRGIGDIVMAFQVRSLKKEVA